MIRCIGLLYNHLTVDTRRYLLLLFVHLPEDLLVRVANHNGVSRRHDYHDDEFDEGAKPQEDGDRHIGEDAAEIYVVRLVTMLVKRRPFANRTSDAAA